MDYPSLLRQALLCVHALSFAIAISAVLRADLALLRVRHIDPLRLDRTARMLTAALGVLWVSGLWLIALDVGLEPQAIFARPKLAAKLIVVTALTLNGCALHALAFPMLEDPDRHGRAGRIVPVLLGAISTTSWCYASFIGLSRLIAASLSLFDYLALYGLALAAAVGVALLYVRPRMAGGRGSRTLPATRGATHRV